MGATQSSDRETGIVTVVQPRGAGDVGGIHPNSSDDLHVLTEVEKELALLGSQLQSLGLVVPASGLRVASPGLAVTSRTARAAIQPAPGPAADSPSRPAAAAAQPDSRDWLGLSSYVVSAARQSEAPAALGRELLAAIRAYRSWLAQRETAAARAQAKLHLRMQQTDEAARSAVERLQSSAAAHGQAAKELEGQLGVLAEGLERLSSRVEKLSAELRLSRQILMADEAAVEAAETVEAGGAEAAGARRRMPE